MKISKLNLYLATLLTCAITGCGRNTLTKNLKSNSTTPKTSQNSVNTAPTDPCLNETEGTDLARKKYFQTDDAGLIQKTLSQFGFIYERDSTNKTLMMAKLPTLSMTALTQRISVNRKLSSTEAKDKTKELMTKRMQLLEKMIARLTAIESKNLEQLTHDQQLASNAKVLIEAFRQALAELS